jgi:hypothetical protein
VRFIDGFARLARDHRAPRVIITRRYCSSSLSATWRSYPLAWKFAHAQFFDPIFEGNFGGLLVLKMGHSTYLRKAPDVYFPMI